MEPSQSPFPTSWIGTALKDEGLTNSRPYVGTYGRYDYTDLPDLPFELTGTFAWLNAQKIHNEHIGNKHAASHAEQLGKLEIFAKETGCQLPDSFVHFMRTARLHARIRSSTDCFLSLASAPMKNPHGAGTIVRFMSDSQACCFWYLYVAPDNSDHAVVTSWDLFDPEPPAWAKRDGPPGPLWYCGRSFEEFMARFWLENEIWMAGFLGESMPEESQHYLKAYQEKANGRNT